MNCSKCGVELNEQNWNKWTQKKRDYICKPCERKRQRKKYRRRIEHYRQKKNEWYRKHVIQPNGQWIRGEKRDFPLDRHCELCGRQPKKRLHYHHWDIEDLSQGIWVCGKCHIGIHWLERGLAETYRSFKLRRSPMLSSPVKKVI